MKTLDNRCNRAARASTASSWRGGRVACVRSVVLARAFPENANANANANTSYRDANLANANANLARPTRRNVHGKDQAAATGNQAKQTPTLPTMLSPSPPVLAPARVVQERALACQLPGHRRRASYQDVVRLDVAVEHRVPVQMPHAAEQLPQQELVCLPLHPAPLLIGRTVPRQQRHVIEGVHETNVITCGGNVQKPQDVRVRRQGRGHSDLKHRAGGQVPLEDLDSYILVSSLGRKDAAE